MLTSMTEKEKKLTVDNIVSACKDIDKLNKRGYNFLYLANGFIAHCSINGFKDYYSLEGSLEQDIRRYAGDNQWHNFHPGDENYDYYMAKKDVYNRIIAEIALDYLPGLC